MTNAIAIQASRLPYHPGVAERFPGKCFDLCDLDGGSRRVEVDQTSGQFGFDRDHGE